MLRRAVASTSLARGASGRGNNNNNKNNLPSWNSAWPRRKKEKAPYKLSSDMVVFVLVGAAALLTLIAYYVPTPTISSQPKRSMVQMEQAASAEIAALWNEFHDAHGNKPPIPQHQHPQYQQQNQNQQTVPQPPENNIVSPKSAVTGASWVQGEQLLKQQLAKLAARQAQGLDIGVPVLTRYLGPDVPAWPSAENNGMTEAEWKAVVESKYAAMRQEEDVWRQKMGEYLQTTSKQWG